MDIISELFNSVQSGKPVMLVEPCVVLDTREKSGARIAEEYVRGEIKKSGLACAITKIDIGDIPVEPGQGRDFIAQLFENSRKDVLILDEPYEMIKRFPWGSSLVSDLCNIIDKNRGPVVMLTGDHDKMHAMMLQYPALNERLRGNSLLFLEEMQKMREKISRKPEDKKAKKKQKRKPSAKFKSR